MTTIRRIEGLERAADAVARDAGDEDRTVSPLSLYRRFLEEAGVESELHAARALAQRTRSTGEERRSLAALAATAEVRAGRLARADDEDGRRHLGFGIGTALAVGLAVADAVPAYLAAQAFGLDLYTTIGVAAVLVAALATAMWAAAHHHSGWQRLLIIGGLGAGLVAVGALRWWYLVVTAGDDASALLEALGLTVFTTLLVWLGVVVLGFTKGRHVSEAERQATSLRRRAERAAVQEADLRRRVDVARRELMGRAQVFSSRAVDDQEVRDRFLASVVAEVEA